MLRHNRVTSEHEPKDPILATIDDINRQPVVHTWSYQLDRAARYDSDLGNDVRRSNSVGLVVHHLGTRICYTRESIAASNGLPGTGSQSFRLRRSPASAVWTFFSGGPASAAKVLGALILHRHSSTGNRARLRSHFDVAEFMSENHRQDFWNEP